MKIKGSELIRFLDDETGGWPQFPTPSCWYWDHEEFDESPDPDIIYDTEALGPILWQGDDGVPAREMGVPEDIDVAVLIRRWRKQQKMIVIEVEVEKENLSYVRKVIKDLGLGKVLTKFPKEGKL